MLKLVQAEKKDETILGNLLQKYLYDMSRYYAIPMGADGNYLYPYLPYYFGEAGRYAYFIYDHELLIGFAMINSHSFIAEKADYCLAEFTIFPAYRQAGKATAAMEFLFAKHRGKWQLKYSTANTPGMRFWTTLTRRYNAKEIPLGDGEIAVAFVV